MSSHSSPELIPEITVQRLFDDRQETLQLEVLNPDIDLDRPIVNPDISRPWDRVDRLHGAVLVRTNPGVW